MEEVNRIASDTTFGGQNLLDGTYGTSFQVGADANQTISFSMQTVGATTNTLTADGGFTLSGIASVASGVTGKAYSTLAGSVQAGDGFADIFAATSISVSTQDNAQ
ncbi:flagellin, partial [Idiomarina xiamenensis 10-D-4]